MKRFLKGCLMALALCALLSFVCIAWMFHDTSRDVPILNYHQINDTAQNALTVNTEQFETQMKYLAEQGYHSITPSEMLDAWENGSELPEKPVIITFDDGYVDNYSNAFPILQKYNLKATIFLIPDYVNVYPNYLTWAQAAEMQRSGLIHFGSHTMNHSVLTELSQTELRRQLVDSKQAIEWHLKQPVTFIAYPCGAYNQQVIERTNDAGYRAAFTVNYGWASPSEKRMVMDRVPIFGSNSHTFLRFKLRLTCAPVICRVNAIKTYLENEGYTSLASLIVIP